VSRASRWRLFNLRRILAAARRCAGDGLALQREEHPGMHATGRSAASLVEIPAITALKVGHPASPETPLLTRSRVLVVERGGASLRKLAPPGLAAPSGPEIAAALSPRRFSA
jgi:hypothetical protein